MLKEITQFIEDQSVIAAISALTIGLDLWAGHRPQDCNDACDVVLETTGGMVYFDLPERADPVIQILSRGTTYFTARDRAWAIYDAIFRRHSPHIAADRAASAGWLLPLDPLIIVKTHEILIIEPLSPPQYIGQDEKLRYEFSCNYIFKVNKL